MKILSLNTRGLGTELKRSLIWKLITNIKVDVVGLQETKVRRWDIAQINFIWGGSEGDSPK